MKKSFIITICALLCAIQVLNAIPARPRKYTKKQPNGTIITLQRHGDEFYHWTTDANGTVVARDKDGNYVPASLPEGEMMGGRAAAFKEAAAIRARRNSMARTRAVTPTTYHFPVILVQFSDVVFSSPTANDDFSRLVNEEGYSANGGTGSVHDYFLENSMGQFDARFDVFGPYTYDGLCKDNAAHADAAKILWDAIQKHDDEIDWSQYDNDGDGYVDMVFMYYAGWNSAEGEDDTIWPHKWNFAPAGVSTTRLDNKRFNIYACSSELKGTSSDTDGIKMCGIGACAHEFSHTQGLPDFYDTNYNDYDGYAGATYEYDIMCTGSYNNEERTPPYFSAQERIMMGWMDNMPDLPPSGAITIPAVNKLNTAHKLSTVNDGEFFIFECRGGSGWDAPLEPGLLVYHVDMSRRYKNSYHYSSGDYAGELSGYDVWTYNTSMINANGAHPCYYIIPADDQDNLNYGGDINNLPFPGASQTTQFIPVDWGGVSYDLFSNIAFNPNGVYSAVTSPVVTMTRSGGFHGIVGKVMTSDNDGIAGAKVSLYLPRVTPAGISGKDGIQLISGRISGNLMIQTTTDEQGNYSFDLPSFEGTSIEIEVSAPGYLTTYETVTFSQLPIGKDFYLRRINEPIHYSLKKYTTIEEGAFVGVGLTSSVQAAIGYKQEELLPYIGRKINKIGFVYTDDGGGSTDAVYALIDAGSTRIVIDVPAPSVNDWTIVDISSENIVLEPKKDYYFGYCLENCSITYPIVCAYEEVKSGGAYIYATLDDSWRTSGGWFNFESDNYGNLLIYVELDSTPPFDYNTIANPGYGNYRVGDSFALVLNEAAGARKPGTAIQWFFDDEPVSGSSVLLKYPGRHVVEARFTTTEGKTKVVELEIEVQP